MIFDAKQQKLYSLRHDEKLYLELSTANTSHAQPQTFDDIVITRTGKRETAAGYVCEVYHTKDRTDGSSGEFCMPKEIGSAALLGMTSAQAGGASLWPGWMREMFKDGGFPKLEVWRAALGKSALWPYWPGILAVASDAPLPAPGVTRLALSDPASIAEFVLANAAQRCFQARL